MKRSVHHSMQLFSKTAFHVLIIFLFITGCKDKKSSEDPIVLSEEKPKIEKSEPGVVEVVTNAMDFKLPKSIPSGWTTFKYRNQSPDTHFFILEKYPEGKNITSATKEIIPVFQQAMDSINVGKTEAGMAVFGNLPEWFHEVQFLGGTGLIAPGKIAQTTVNLEPGNYLIECYVKMNNGMFHSTMGMLEEFTVTKDNNGKEPPTANSEINISSTKGIEFKNEIQAGRQTFKVNFLDQKTYPNFVGHDVHLVKLTKDADLKTLEKWMNWLDPKGFISPMPAGFEFMGGLQEMPGGNSGYFTVNLTEGRYAFISEVPDASKLNMLKEFTIQNKDMASK